jgi:nucleoside-diphosphate-sugar epimerase
MKVSLIGSNGLLSDSIGRFCNSKDINLDVYGLYKPINHVYDNFYAVDLLKEDLEYDKIKCSDIIIYAVGAGIQSNLDESANQIYILNVGFPVKICNCLKQKDYKGIFVTFGSYFEIGETTDNKLYNEMDVICSRNNPPNDYAISKRMLSRFISSFNAQFKTWHFILPTIYGEKESLHRLIPYTINALKTDNDIQFTSGEQIRQYVYIDEISYMINLAYKNRIPSGVYNIAGNETLTVKELVSMLFKAYNKDLSESVFGKEKRVDVRMKSLQLEGIKLYKELNYKPIIKILDVYKKY